MFLVISSIDDHIISYASNSRNAKEYCIQFPLEHVLSNNGTHWKSSPLKSSNVQSHCSVFSQFRISFNHPVALVKISNYKLCHSMEFSNDFLNGTCVVWLSFQGLIQVWDPSISRVSCSQSVLGYESYWNQLEASFP